jgi:hypothetical protein
MKEAVFAAKAHVQEQNLIAIQELAMICTMILLTAEVMEMFVQEQALIVMREAVLVELEILVQDLRAVKVIQLAVQKPAVSHAMNIFSYAMEIVILIIIAIQTTAEVVEMSVQERTLIVMREAVFAAQAHAREQLPIAIQEPATIYTVM